MYLHNQFLGQSLKQRKKLLITRKKKKRIELNFTKKDKYMVKNLLKHQDVH